MVDVRGVKIGRPADAKERMPEICEGLETSPTGAKLAAWARDRKPKRANGLRGDVKRPTPYLMFAILLADPRSLH